MKSGIRITDIMTPKLIVAKADMTVHEISKLMNKHRIGGMPVVDNNKKLIGMITERDIILKVIAKDKKPSKVRIKDIMTSPAKLIANPQDDITYFAKKMSKLDIARAPVAIDGKLVGFITNRDILRSSPQLIDCLIEKAKISNSPHNDLTSFGKCDICSNSSHLIFKKDKFLCEFCL